MRLAEIQVGKAYAVRLDAGKPPLECNLYKFKVTGITPSSSFSQQVKVAPVTKSYWLERYKSVSPDDVLYLWSDFTAIKNAGKKAAEMLNELSKDHKIEDQMQARGSNHGTVHLALSPEMAQEVLLAMQANLNQASDGEADALNLLNGS